LSPNSIIKAEFVLKCNFNFSSAKDQPSLVCIPGYPSMTEKENLRIRGNKPWPNNYALFYDKMLIRSSMEKENGLLYMHSTTNATSGAPLLMNTFDSYEVVGIHVRE
jgi:hypothetical protein